MEATSVGCMVVSLGLLALGVWRIHQALESRRKLSRRLNTALSTSDGARGQCRVAGRLRADEPYASPAGPAVIYRIRVERNVAVRGRREWQQVIDQTLHAEAALEDAEGRLPLYFGTFELVGCARERVESTAWTGKDPPAHLLGLLDAAGIPREGLLARTPLRFDEQLFKDGVEVEVWGQVKEGGGRYLHVEALVAGGEAALQASFSGLAWEQAAVGGALAITGVLGSTGAGVLLWNGM